MVSGDDEIRKEERRDAAEQILLDSGVLKRCPIDEALYHPEGDDSNAYREASNRIRKDERLKALFDGRTDLLQVVCETLKDFGFECPLCIKRKDE